MRGVHILHYHSESCAVTADGFSNALRVSVQGGLKAVVWTDAIQSLFTTVSIIIVIILGFAQVGGFGNMVQSNLDGGRIEFFKYTERRAHARQSGVFHCAARSRGRRVFFFSKSHLIVFSSMDPDPFMRDTFWTVSVGTVLSWINSLGIHPGAVQRFVALPTLKKAQSAMVYFGLGMGVVKVLTGLVGMLIYAKYKDCDPTSAGVSELSYRSLHCYPNT